MTAFLTKLNGAEVAVNVDDILAQAERIKAQLAKARAALATAKPSKVGVWQKAVDKYQRRLDRLQATVAQMYRHGLSGAQKAQIADVKYEEQEARKAQEKIDAQHRGGAAGDPNQDQGADRD